MSRKIKLAPVSMDSFNFENQSRPGQAPIDILAPRSFELSTDMATASGVGVLGNTLVGQRFLPEREYNFNWVGDKNEIDKIRFYLTQTSTEYFMFGGLTDNRTITPTVMYNSKAMLASLVDQYKPVNSEYQNYLPRYRFENAPRRGSIGVRMGNILATQFDTLPPYALGARAYVLLDKHKNYSWAIDQNYGNSLSENPHTVPFRLTAVALSPTNGGIVKYGVTTFSSIGSYAPFIDTGDSDVLVRLELYPPTGPENQESFNNSNLVGILNYSAPIIAETKYFDQWSTLENVMNMSYEDQPSILTPSSSGVYNMVNKRIAEFSISFKEIVYEVSR